MPLHVPPQENDDFYDSQHPPLEGDPLHTPLPFAQPSQGLVPVDGSEKDIREQKPAVNPKTGFTGKTQAELWAHLLKTQGSVAAIVHAIQSETKEHAERLNAGDNSELPATIAAKINKRYMGLKQELVALGIGPKVADNLLRVEMARLEKKHAVSALQALDAVPEQDVVEWVGKRVADTAAKAAEERLNGRNRPGWGL